MDCPAGEVYTRWLEAYRPWDELEARHWQVHRRCWADRAIGAGVPERHLTASAFVVHPAGTSVLAHWHAKLGRWLQPGGHLDPGESPVAACLRELAEETGLELDPPGGIFDLDVHPIVETSRMPAHYHVDARFLFHACSDELPRSPEQAELRWLTWEELAKAGAADAGLARVASKASYRSGFRVNGATIRAERFLGKGKSGRSFLARSDGRDVVLKVMHDEPCPYYRFGDKLAAELAAYEELTRLDAIAVPALLAVDKDAKILVKEYVPGTDAARAVADGSVLRELLERVWRAARRLEHAGCNIDYFPTNFVVCAGAPVYVDYEINPFSPLWSFGRWGIFYWVNQAGMREFLATGDSRAINVSPDSGIPIQAPFRDRVADLLASYERAATAGAGLRSDDRS